MRWNRCLTLTAVFCSAPLVFAQRTVEQRYVISIGDASGKISSGTLWLYSYSWYGLQQFKLSSIQDGLAVVPLDVDRLKKEVDPHPNTDAYVVVVQIGQNQWFRTPDIPSDRFWADLPGAINSLGRITTISTSETQLILPSLVKRHLTLLYPDGRPAANADLDVSIYLWDQNHCAVHMGLPLGKFRTDKTGTIEISAPLVDLYLEGIFYYHEVGPGPAGTAYSSNHGMRIGPEENQVLKEAWQFTDDDSLTDEYELRVLTATGRPRANVDIWVNWQTNTCGGGDKIATTDSKGSALIDLDPSVTGLGVGNPDDEYRRLSNDELRELFSKHKLTIRWTP